MDSDSAAGGTLHDPTQSYTSLQDLLAQTGALASYSNDGGLMSGPEGPGGGGGVVGSPSAAGAVDFNDLLAQFTLPGTALSPGGPESAKSPDTSGLMAMLAGMGAANGGGAEGGAVGGGFSDLLGGGKSAQEVLLESLKGYTPGAATPGSTSAPSPAQIPSFAPQQGVDFQAQLQQLLAQSLSNSMAAMSGTPTPTGPPSSTAGGTAPFHPPSHLQQQQNGHAFSPQSPTGYPSQPASAQASPMPLYPGASMAPHSSFPPSAASSPYIAPSNGSANPSYAAPPPSLPQQQPPLPTTLPNGFVLPPSLQQAFSHPALQQGQQNPITAQAQLAAMQLLINAQAQVQAQAQAAQMHAQAQAQVHAQQQQQQQQQHQHAVDPHAHAQAVAAAQLQLQQAAGGATGMAPPPSVGRNGSLTASSLAPSVDGSYRENEFIFSPLMSPAMTPHSVFTNASSLPPSVGPVPLVAPTDFFPPLTSPALGPQLYPGDVRLAAHRHSLQGLVDGVGALSTQLPPPPGSPSTAFYSPRLNPTDAGTSTGAGAGRRGAGASKKTRPSPLIKPTDPSLDRKRRKGGSTSAPSVGGDKRGTNGSKSATSSPFLGPSGVGGGSTNGYGTHARAASATSGSSRPSPPEGGAGGASQASISTTSASVGSFDTPSPVDLSTAAVTGGPTPSANEGLPVPPPQSLQAQMFSQMLQQQQQAQHVQPISQPYQLEPMGPPPVPQHLQQQQHQSLLTASASGSTSAAPVTPASFMNFSSDFDMNTLSALGPIPQAAYEGTSASAPGSAFSSVQNSPALLPQRDHSLPMLPAASIAPSALDEPMGAIFQHHLVSQQQQQQQQQQDEIFVEPLPPVASTSTSNSTSTSTSSTAPSTGKAPRTRRTSVSARASPALKAVDAKGKGKAVSSSTGGAAGGVGAAGTGTTASGKKKPQKIAPSPRIGPSPKIRPLLASGAATDAQGRLVDGHGDILALPPSASPGTNGTAAGGADNRRSSHKVAEQKRRDSLKLCFDELRQLLPPILPYTDESDRRPGDGNVGGQRHGEVDMSNPNKGVSKVALLRRSNEYLEILRDRIERRDRAISALREQLGQMRVAAGLGELGEEEEEVPGLELDLDSLDKEERAAGNLAFYEDLDFDSRAPPPALNRKPSRRSSIANSAPQQQQQQPAADRPTTRRRTTRASQAAAQGDSMDVEGGEE